MHKRINKSSQQWQLQNIREKLSSFLMISIKKYRLKQDSNHFCWEDLNYDIKLQIGCSQCYISIIALLKNKVEIHFSLLPQVSTCIKKIKPKYEEFIIIARYLLRKTTHYIFVISES